MKIRHHIVRKFRDSAQAPLWKWVVVIFIIVAMPLFFTFVRTTQIQQVVQEENNAQEQPLPPVGAENN